MRQGEQEPVREHEPNVRFEFLFSAHGMAEDWRRLREHFNACDVYVPEVVGWTTDDLDTLRAIATGDIGEKYRETPLRRGRRAFTEFLRTVFDPTYFYDLREPGQLQIELLHNSQKPVFLVDVPEASPIYPELQALDERASTAMGQGLSAFWDGDIQSVLAGLRRQNELKVAWLKLREQEIVNRLGHLKEEILDAYPKLKAQPEIRALVCLGTGHTAVDQMTKAFASTKRHLGQPLHVFSPTDEAVRRLQRNKPVDDQLLAHELMFTLAVACAVPRRLVEELPYYMWTLLGRRMAEPWSVEEVTNLSTHISTIPDRMQAIRELRQAFTAKGIPLPQTAQAVRAILKADRSAGSRIE